MRVFLFLVPLWLLGLIIPPTANSESTELLQFAALIWLPLIGAACGLGKFVVGPIFRERTSILYLTVASFAALTASALLSEEPLRSTAYVAAAAVGLTACAGIWRLVANRMIGCLAVYAVLGTAFAAFVYFQGPRIQGRLSISPTSHPNFLGLVAFSFLICSLAVANLPLKGCLIAINFAVITQTESRSALVAAFLGLLTYATIQIVRTRKGKAAFLLAGTSLVSVVFILVYQDAIENMVSSLLFLNDKYRGLGTGFTGRVDIWQEAYDLFLHNPWFGVGFRMHEAYMTTSSSAHNGYLSLLAEVGVVGTLAIAFLTITLYWNLLRQALRGSVVAALGVSFVTGYLFLATFERFFINMGNPTSILTWLFLLAPGRIQITPRRVHALQPAVGQVDPLCLPPTSQS